MRYRVLNSIFAIACCSVMAIPRARAQLTELQAGARVRVRAPAVVAGRLEATVIARSPDSVTLTTPRGAPITVPLAAVTSADVSRGRSRRDGAVKGLTWGTGVGLAMGVLGAVGYDASSDACGVEPCDNELTSGEFVAASVMTGALLGTAIGAIVGTEHWERLTLPARVVVRRSSERVVLTLAIRF